MIHSFIQQFWNGCWYHLSSPGRWGSQKQNQLTLKRTSYALFCIPLCWLLLCWIITSSSHLGREKLNWENVPTRTGLVGIAPPDLVALNAVRSRMSKPWGGKPGKSSVDFPGSFQFLPLGSCPDFLDRDWCGTVSWNKPCFSTKMLLVMELYHSNRNSKTASLFMKHMPRTRKGYGDEIAFCAPCKKGYTHTYTLSLPLTVLQGVNKGAQYP